MAWRKPANLREWLRIVFRHKKKFIFPALGTMILVVWASQFVPREFRAEGVFERRSESVTESADARKDQLLSPIRSSLIQDMTGRPSIEQLVDDLHLTRNLPHNPDGTLTSEGQLAKFDLVKQIQGKLRVNFSIQTDQVDRVVVSYTDVDRVLAPKIVNRAITNYIDATREQLNARLVTAKAFFEREVGRYRAKVSDLEAKKLRFELDNPGLLPDDPLSLQNRLTELRARVDRIEQELMVTVEKRKRLQEWANAQEEFIEKRLLQTNPVLQQYQARLGDLQRQLDEHLNGWGRTEDHPLVKKTRAMIAEMEKRMETIEKEVPGGSEKTPNPQRASALQEVQSLTGTIVGLERQRDEIRNEAERLEVLSRNFFVVRNEYQRIIRELDEANGQLKFWETNLRTTSLTLQQEVAQHGMRMSIYQLAPELARPSRPTVVGILGVSLVLGLLAGAAMIVMTELLDHSFQSVEQAVDDLKLPVLGTVNEIVSPAEIWRRKVVAWGVCPAVGTVMVLILLLAFYLTWLNLEQPQYFEQLKQMPLRTIKEMIIG